MEIIIASILVIIAVSIYVKYRGYKDKKAENDFAHYLSSLESFDLNLETLKIDGFNWQENIAVDIYDNELNPYDDKFYKKYRYDTLSFKNRFHKNTNKTKFYSKLYVPIEYKGVTKTFDFNLPIEHTILRMKFYMKKSMKIYVEYSENKDSKRFILDFTFLENEYVNYKVFY